MLGAVTRKLNRDTGERKALFRDLVGALILNGRVETTVARAKETKKIADRLVDLALRGDLHARRQVRRLLTDDLAVRRCSARSRRSFRRAAGDIPGSCVRGRAGAMPRRWPS